MIAVSFIPAEYAVEIWPKIRGYIRSATERTGGRYEPEDVLYEILDGKLLLWAVIEGTEILGVATTRFMEYPRKKTLMVPFLAGKGFSDWGGEVVATLGKWAANNGCSAMEAAGRPGWERILDAYGYKRLWDWFEAPVHTASDGE